MNPQLSEARALARPYPYRDYYVEHASRRWSVIRCRNQRIAGQIARYDGDTPLHVLRRATLAEVADYQRQMGLLEVEEAP